MAKNYYLRFLLRDQIEDLIFPVRESEQVRLRSLLYQGDMHPIDTKFFWFDAIDGRGVAINLAQVQAVRYLCDLAALPPDAIHFEGGITIRLRGRLELVNAYPEDAAMLFDFFSNLQYGPEVVPFPYFEDEDGEPFQFNAREIVWVTASKALLDEGGQIPE